MSSGGSGSDQMCAGCEEQPAVDSGLCRDCADWCAAFFTRLFPEEDEEYL